jgi:hypothetical protein
MNHLVDLVVSILTDVLKTVRSQRRRKYSRIAGESENSWEK